MFLAQYSHREPSGIEWTVVEGAITIVVLVTLACLAVLLLSTRKGPLSAWQCAVLCGLPVSLGSVLSCALTADILWRALSDDSAHYAGSPPEVAILHFMRCSKFGFYGSVLVSIVLGFVFAIGRYRRGRHVSDV
jgi:hypothetical protein